MFQLLVFCCVLGGKISLVQCPMPRFRKTTASSLIGTNDLETIFIFIYPGANVDFLSLLNELFFLAKL